MSKITVPESVRVNNKTIPVEISSMGNTAAYAVLWDRILIPRKCIEYGSQELVDYLLDHEIEHAKDIRNLRHNLKIDISNYVKRPLWVSKEMAECDRKVLKKLGMKKGATMICYKMGISILMLPTIIARPYYLFYKKVERVPDEP